MFNKRRRIIDIAIGIIILFFFLCLLLLSVLSRLHKPNEKHIFYDNKIYINKSYNKSYVDQNIATNSVDKLLKNMDKGSISFNAPLKININDSPQIQLILSLSETIDELMKLIVEEGEKVGAIVSASSRMEARLSGYMFKITAITPEIQAVSKSKRTEWKWEIHPKKKGKHRLHLTLSVLLKIDGQNTPLTIKTFTKKIDVYVTATQEVGLFFKNNWQWLWVAIFVPIVGILLKLRKNS